MTADILSPTGARNQTNKKQQKNPNLNEAGSQAMIERNLKIQQKIISLSQN